MADEMLLSQREAEVTFGAELSVRLGRLTAIAFAAFAGVVQPSPAKTAWYLARPGMDRDLSGVIVCAGEIASSVYVTRLRFAVGGQPFQMAMIDTVVTHPDFRRRGMARRLLQRALDGARAAGLDGVSLYTVPQTLPFAIYTRLGFRPYRQSMVWTEKGASSLPAGAATVRSLRDEEENTVRDLVRRFNAGRDGFVPLDDTLWRWRKHQRPPHMPADVRTAWDGSRLVGTVTLCPVELVSAGGPARHVYLTDLGLADDASDEAVLSSLLATRTSRDRYISLAGENDAALAVLFSRLGFVATPGEMCLIYPLQEALQQALARSERPWYVLPESVVGV